MASHLERAQKSGLPEMFSTRGCQTCPAAEAKLIRNEGISGIAQWMEEVQTDPEIRTAIETRLLQWADNLPMLPIQTDSVVLQDAIQHQDAIGWDNFFEGRNYCKRLGASTRRLLQIVP